MKRAIDIETEFGKLNPWIQKSITLFNEKSYPDQISEIYNYSVDEPQRIDEDLRSEIKFAHHNKRDKKLINLYGS